MDNCIAVFAFVRMKRTDEGGHKNVDRNEQKEVKQLPEEGTS
jgi:hypothetical protein